MKSWVWVRSFLTVCAVAALLNIGRSADPKSDGPANFAQRIVELTNIERARYGLKPVVLEGHLNGSAQWKARDMATKNYFDHQDFAGHGFIERAKEQGYAGWRFLGENIAAGQGSPEEVVSQWMASPGHRSNILKPDYYEIGIGYATDSQSSYHRYWVQEFGAR